MDTWKFSWITSWDEVWHGRLKTCWTGTQNDALYCSPFYYQPNLQAWVDAKGGEAQLSPIFVLAEARNANSILLPLVMAKPSKRKSRLQTALPVGHTDYDYHDPIILGPSANSYCITADFWSELARALTRSSTIEVDRIVLPRVRAPLLEEADVAKVVESASYLRLADYDCFEQYVQGRSKNLRKSIRRKINKFLRNGPMAYKIYGANETEEFLAELPRFEAAGRKKYPTGGPDYTLLQNLVKNDTGGSVHCSTLTTNGVAVSWHIGFIDRERLYSYAPMFDEAYAELSPGFLHMYYLTEDAFEQGLEELDFMRGSERYKDEWADGAQTDLLEVSVENASFASKARQLTDKIHRKSRRLVRSND